MAIQQLAGVVYNNGGSWDLLLTGGHDSIGTTSISSSTDSWTVNFSFTATDVYTFVVSPDETLSRAGVLCGASVGLTSARVDLTSIAGM